LSLGLPVDFTLEFEMNDSQETQPTRTFWIQVTTMIALGSALFASLEFIPNVLGGAVGTIVTVCVGSIFLYLLGRHIGSLAADAEA
jgi:hypothetical protein